MKRIMAWMATAAALTFVLPAAAGQTDSALDALFARLKSASDPREARQIEGMIWRIWHDSGDDAVNRIMATGLHALSMRDHGAALKAFDDVVRTAPDFAEGWNKRATVHYLMGNFDASIADIERTLFLEPRHFGALSGLGLVDLARKSEVSALNAFEAALDIYPLLPGADTHIRELRERLRGKSI